MEGAGSVVGQGAGCGRLMVLVSASDTAERGSPGPDTGAAEGGVAVELVELLDAGGGGVGVVERGAPGVIPGASLASFSLPSLLGLLYVAPMVGCGGVEEVGDAGGVGGELGRGWP